MKRMSVEAERAISRSLRSEWPAIRDAHKTDPNWAMKAVMRAAAAAFEAEDKIKSKRAK